MGLWDKPGAGGPSAAQPRAPRVFLAYAPADHDFADTLNGDLRQRGVTIEDDPVGANSSALPQLAQSAAAPEWLIVVLSPSALRSSLIAQEMHAAAELLQLRRLRGALAITATSIPPNDIPPTWPITSSFDATRDYTTALRDLCAAIGLVESMPALAPVPPPPDPTKEETAPLPAAVDVAREETAPIPSLARKSAKGVTRRALMGAGLAVAGVALAGGAFQVWRTAPTPQTLLPTPTVRWRYLINSNAVTPALETRGAIYFGTADGHFYALDAASHSLRWAYDTQGEIRPDDPVVEAGAVYCCTADGAVLKLSDDRSVTSDAKRLLWRFLYPRAMALTPALSAGVLYVSYQYSRLFAVNSHNGDIIWTASPTFRPSSPPTLDGDHLYVAGLNTVFALRNSDYAPIWKSPVGGVVAQQIVLSHGALYACMKYSKAFAFDAATGKQRWSFATSGQIFTPPVVDESHGAVFIGDAHNFVYALDARSGALRWRQKLDNAVFSLKYFKGSLHVVSRGGYLYAFDPATGIMRWQYVVGQGVTSPLGVGAETLYAGSADGYLYALDVPD